MQDTPSTRPPHESAKRAHPLSRAQRSVQHPLPAPLLHETSTAFVPSSLVCVDALLDWPAVLPALTRMSLIVAGVMAARAVVSVVFVHVRWCSHDFA